MPTKTSDLTLRDVLEFFGESYRVGVEVKRMPTRVLESTVEAAFVRQCKARGLVTLKLNLQGNRGWPDRLVLLPVGRVLFIEFKRPGGTLRPLQRYVHGRIRKLGFRVCTCDSVAGASQAIRDSVGI